MNRADAAPEAVLTFWLEEIGPEGWYKPDPEVDAAIARRFGPVWRDAAAGGLRDWKLGASGMLAYLVVTDQFSRNMHRGAGAAFSTDGLARRAALSAIDRGLDMQIAEPERQFFYLPLMHAESLPQQDRCVRLFMERMPETGGMNFEHACNHREVIRRFGRFPYRNAALGRRSSPAEAAFMKAGGYGG